MEWRPHPRQEEALKRIEFEILYGGARGGGKTDAGLVWLTDYIKHPRFRALVIRKNADDLSDWVDRANYFYHSLGARIAYRPAEITFPSGAKIKTGHLKDDQAYTKYQGQEYQRILLEELTQIPHEKRYLQLLASCRSTIKELVPQVFCTTNPGGVGHGWVKKRFVDPAPPNVPFLGNDGRSRIYIPAQIDDNPSLVMANPQYVDFLEALKETDIELYKAWRLGDWNTFAGQFFKEFRRDIHVVSAFIPSKERFIFVAGMDWGRVAPFSFHVSAIETINHEGIKFNRAFTFCEVYGVDKTPREWAAAIKEKLLFYGLDIKDLAWTRGDPAMFTKGLDNSISIADQFKVENVTIKPASNDRIGGWENLHNWLSVAIDGSPYWAITNNCTNLIRTLPELVHNEPPKPVEDVDTEGEDHAPDANRYMFKHLKWIDSRVGGIGKTMAPKPKPTAQMKNGKQVSIDLEKFSEAAVKYSRNHGRV